MPLMQRVLKKISSIVEEELDAIGCLETLLPQLHPADIWKKSGRWKGYTDGEGIMFHLTDRQNKKYGLGPTHEEVITQIASETLNSYKQLPVKYYQIQTKFRDEIRPRFGLMRSREFIMKDAYSFHANEKDLKKTYLEMGQAYQKIFNRCGVKFVRVDADSGAIGGASSQEFMVTADAGEDLVLISEDGKYSANQEKAVSKAKGPKILNPLEPSIINTPNQKSINDLCTAQNLDASQIIKVLIFLAIFEDGKQQPVLISIRGDQELNEIKLTNYLTSKRNTPILDLTPITKDHLEAEGLEPIPFGSLGPDLSDSILKNSKKWEHYFLRISDQTASELKSFVCGANKQNTHRIYYNWLLIGEMPETVDIRKAKAGDKSIHDDSQELKECRGIEIGHIFELGCKYSKALNATFTNKNGAQEPFWMGCYGIGISRLAQSAVEQSHDKDGIIWPIAIAPYEVIIVIANIKDSIQQKLAEEIYQTLKSEGIDVLLDDRDERAGLKFKDADLIGIPWRIVIGRDSSLGLVEIHERCTKSTESLKKDIATEKISTDIYKKKGLFVPKAL